MKEYRKATPPRLPIENIKVPIGFFVGNIDPWSSVLDNKYVMSKLKTKVTYEELDDFDHSTFVRVKPNLLIDKVIKMIN